VSIANPQIPTRNSTTVFISPDDFRSELGITRELWRRRGFCRWLGYLEANGSRDVGMEDCGKIRAEATSTHTRNIRRILFKCCANAGRKIAARLFLQQEKCIWRLYGFTNSPISLVLNTPNSVVLKTPKGINDVG